MDYVTIRVSTLRGDQKINFDVYVKINDKHIHYLRRGDSFEGQRLKRLKEKKLKQLFIKNDDEALYRQYLKSNIDSAYDPQSNKDIQTRAEIVQGEQQSNVEAVLESPENKTAYIDTKDAAGKYANLLLQNAQMVTSVLNIENTDKNISHHGVTVSTLAVSLAQKLKITDPKILQTLALGALLHDIGHHDTPINIAQSLKQLSAEDLKVYKNHVNLGCDRVKEKPHFDQQVIRIINEHEELSDGSGFPKKLRENQCDSLSVIVSSCNTFDRLISFESMAKSEVAKHMIINEVGKHPLNHIQTLNEIIKKV